MAKKKGGKKGGNANNQRVNGTPKPAAKPDEETHTEPTTPVVAEHDAPETPVSISPLPPSSSATTPVPNGHAELSPTKPIFTPSTSLASTPTVPLFNPPPPAPRDPDGDVKMTDSAAAASEPSVTRPVFGPPLPPNFGAAKAPAASPPTPPPLPSFDRDAAGDAEEEDAAPPPVEEPATTQEPPVAEEVKPEPAKPKPEPEPEVPSAEAEELKEQGNAQYKAKNYSEAIDFYTRAINLRPTEPSYLNNRAAAYMALKRFKPALSDCQAAAVLQSAAPSPKTLNRVAKCHLALGSPSACILTLQQVLALDPKDAQALECRKKAAVMQEYLDRFEKARALKDWGQARWALDRATDECEGDQPILWRVWKVEVDIARRKWDEALQQASDAVRMDQNDPDALAARGLALFLTNKMQLALDHLTVALRLDQEHTRARTLLRRIKDVERKKEEGNVAFKANKMEAAIEKWTETLDAIGEKEEEGGGGHVRAVLLSNRANAYQKLNKNNEALGDIDASLQLLPTSFKALRTRARIRLAKEEYEDAVRDFKQAQEVAESSSEAKPVDIKAIAEELKQAEIQLKRSKSKDYYKILGIERTASDAEIKKAYRKESLRHHPDKGGDEEKFKLVVEANTVLSDPQRRYRYDNGMDEDGSMDGGGMGGFGGGVDINDILFAMGGGAGGGFRSSSFGSGFPGGGPGRNPFGSQGHFHGFSH